MKDADKFMSFPEFKERFDIKKNYLTNCGNNKMLEPDWFLTAFIFCLIWLVQHQSL